MGSFCDPKSCWIHGNAIADTAAKAGPSLPLPWNLHLFPYISDITKLKKLNLYAHNTIYLHENMPATKRPNARLGAKEINSYCRLSPHIICHRLWVIPHNICQFIHQYTNTNTRGPIPNVKINKMAINLKLTITHCLWRTATVIPCNSYKITAQKIC